MNTPYDNFFLEVLIIASMIKKPDESLSRGLLLKALTSHNYFKGELSSLIDPEEYKRITT